MVTTRATGQTGQQTRLERYIEAGQISGCPKDQMRNLVRAGVVLQPKQLMFAAAARMCDQSNGPTEIGMGGARGGGKSHATLAVAGADDCQRYPGLKFLYLRQIGKKAREAFEDLIPRVFVGLKYNYRASGELTFENGSRIILGHFKDEKDVDQYLGIEYDGAIIEEATTLSARKIDNLRGSIRTAKQGWRPRIYFTTNPGGIGHVWFKKRFVDPHRKAGMIARLPDQAGGTRFIPSTVDDNKFVNKEYVSTLDSLTGWLLRAWRYGDWDIAAGQYFSNFRHEAHVVAPFRIPENWPVWGGLDYGFTHYTTFYLATRSNDGTIYAIGEHGERQWVVKRHVEAMQALADRVLGANGWRRVQFVVAGADVFGKRGSDRTVAEQYADEGVEFTRANDDRISGATAILGDLGDSDRGIAPRFYVFNTCPRLIEALPAMQHDPNRPEDVLKVDIDEDGAGGDDFYDGWRYTRMAADKVGGLAIASNPLANWRG